MSDFPVDLDLDGSAVACAGRRGNQDESMSPSLRYPYASHLVSVLRHVAPEQLSSVGCLQLQTPPGAWFEMETEQQDLPPVELLLEDREFSRLFRCGEAGRAPVVFPSHRREDDYPGYHQHRQVILIPHVAITAFPGSAV